MANGFKIGFCIFIWFEYTKAHGSERFVHNQQFQSQLIKNQQEFRPTLSKFHSMYSSTQSPRKRVSNPKVDRIYFTSTTQSPRKIVTIAEANNKNSSQLAQASETNNIIEEFKKPSIKELQQVISKIVKSPSKIHQVVKAPAVYELHLQEVEPWKFNSLRSSSWRKPSKYYNRPIKRYLNQRPFKLVNGRNKVDYPPELSWYYAKKNEPQHSLGRKNLAAVYQSYIRRNGENFFPFLTGLHYIFHVREAGDK